MTGPSGPRRRPQPRPRVTLLGRLPGPDPGCRPAADRTMRPTVGRDGPDQQKLMRPHRPEPSRWWTGPQVVPVVVVNHRPRNFPARREADCPTAGRADCPDRCRPKSLRTQSIP